MKDLSDMTHDELVARLQSVHRRAERYMLIGNEALERIALKEGEDVRAELAKRLGKERA